MESITLNNLCLTVFTAAVPLILRFFWQLCSSEYNDSKYADAIQAVFSSVEYVNQTFTDSLKQSGCFDEEAQEIALKKAKNTALDLMHTSTLKWLERSFVDLDHWLTVQIEAAVKSHKAVTTHG